MQPPPRRLSRVASLSQTPSVGQPPHASPTATRYYSLRQRSATLSHNGHSPLHTGPSESPSTGAGAEQSGSESATEDRVDIAQELAEQLLRFHGCSEADHIQLAEEHAEAVHDHNSLHEISLILSRIPNVHTVQGADVHKMHGRFQPRQSENWGPAFTGLPDPPAPSSELSTPEPVVDDAITTHPNEHEHLRRTAGPLPELPFDVILSDNEDFDPTRRVRLVNIYDSKVTGGSMHLVFSHDPSFEEDFHVRRVNIFFTGIGYEQATNVAVVGDRAQYDSNDSETTTEGDDDVLLNDDDDFDDNDDANNADVDDADNSDDDVKEDDEDTVYLKRPNSDDSGSDEGNDDASYQAGDEDSNEGSDDMLDTSDHDEEEGKDLDDMDRFGAKRYGSEADVGEPPDVQTNVHDGSQDRSIDAQESDRLHVCLHASEINDPRQIPKAEFDIDSIMGFPTSLAFAKKGVKMNPAPHMIYNLASDVHLTLPVDVNGKPRRVPLHKIPHYLFGRVVGFDDLSLYVFFPRLFNPDYTDNTYLTQATLQRWIDKVLLATLYTQAEGGTTQHYPADYTHAKMSSLAKYAETHSRTPNDARQLAMTYFIPPQNVAKV